MIRLTDERLAEILRPKDIIGQTELESLASEVRELREYINTRNGDQVSALTDAAELEIRNRELTSLAYIREPNEGAKQPILWRDIARKEKERGDNLERQRDNLQSAVNAVVAETGSGSVDTAIEWIGNVKLDMERLQAECTRLTRERDEARELLRRFREQPCIDESGNVYYLGSAQKIAELCREYDARFSQQQPEPDGDLVPWDSETRPRGVVLLRSVDDRKERLALTWNETHANAACWGWIAFGDMATYWEWSRDGKTWQRCGVRK